MERKIAMAIRWFEGAKHASAYVQYRPSYSIQIRDVIKSFMEKHGCGFDCIADAATGSGQALAYWTDVFRKCIGLDISAEQIKNAKTVFQEKGVKNVEFHVCPAEDLPLSSNSCDLVTCAMGWHWLDAGKFYSECTRVLRKPGVLAVYGYGYPFFPQHKKATEVSMEFQDFLARKCWHPSLRHIRNQYKEVKLPYSVTERFDITQEWHVPLSHYMAFLRTLATYRKYMSDYPGDDPLDAVHKELKDAFSAGDTDPIVDCTFPVFIILGTAI